MMKGGLLKDDSDRSKLGVKEGQKLMMMVTADEIVKAPEKCPVFMEDLPEEEQVVAVICEPKLMPLYLVALLQSLKGEKCIVFTSSVDSTHRLCTLLKFFGDLGIKMKEYSGHQHQTFEKLK